MIEYVIGLVARRLNVSPLAVKMFKKANEISGIDKETLPTELIPLNTIQLSRGLLNFALLQSIRDWVLPYWVERQYDPQSTSFIPRSHLGLSMNLTQRNWTAVGTMECDVEPIVDPRGLVTPFREGWSLDVWWQSNGEQFFPSKANVASQRLVGDCPVVETHFVIGTTILTLTSFVVSTELVHRASVQNNAESTIDGVLYFAVRPFNPEGVCLIEDLEYLEQERRLIVNKDSRVNFTASPHVVECSTHEHGDCANALSHPDRTTGATKVHCSVGLANAAFGYTVCLAPTEAKTFEVTCSLQEPALRWDHGTAENEALRYWENLLGQGAKLATPDQRINSLFTASLTTLLLLIDKESITPGPFTYHQFWFRDAAYMLWALDKFGFSRYTEPVIRSFAKKQKRSGYFRSQQGEWDSNGQVLWVFWQHALLSNNTSLLQEQFASLQSGANWIERKRTGERSSAEKPFSGLMPRGLSAEHLGLADYYFWDNFWSLAGLESFVATSERLGNQESSERTREAMNAYRKDIERAILFAQEKSPTQAITAGPMRGIDCGMIGSICAWYPLQVLATTDLRLLPTLQNVSERFFVQGMFFQDFIHSGMNVYLTLQVAHAWLFNGEREKFWEIFSTACAVASPTMNFPEAIHPATQGGCMGDGHHGWAAAEVVLALRDAFVYERKRADGSTYDLVLLGGLPLSWFTSGKPFFVERVPVIGGTISVHVGAGIKNKRLEIDFEPTNILVQRLIVILPFVAQQVVFSNGEVFYHRVNDGESTIELQPGIIRFEVVA